MSDLSWFNPTPHAIAVYASQPLLPVATQHSLPSGRYSLLGPDFHRLDRASFAWRTHSLQRFVTARRPLSVIASVAVRGWRACYGTGTNNREVSRESPRDQSGRRRCAVRHHVRAGIDHAYEPSRGRSERPRAWPKRALSPPASVPIAQLLLRPLLRLWRVPLWTKLIPLWIRAIAEVCTAGGEAQNILSNTSPFAEARSHTSGRNS